MSNIKISVIVPCYNQAKYLDECLHSVLDQTYENWECIIINDGSTDDSEIVAEKWCRLDDRFRYFYQQNGGVSSARNLGMGKAAGEWILPLDGDDKIGPNYLIKAEEKISEGFDLIYCEGSYFGKRDGKISAGKYNFSDILRYNMIFVSAVFRKDESVLYDGHPLNKFEDWEFWINYLKNEDRKVYKIDEALFHYRILDDSRNSVTTKDQESIRLAKRYIYCKHEEIYHREFGDYLDLLDRCMISEHDVQIYKKAYESQRYKIGNAIASIFDKFRK